MAASVRETCCK